MPNTLKYCNLKAGSLKRCPMSARSIRLGLSAILIVAGVVSCTETSSQESTTTRNCTDFSLSANAPRVALTGEVPVWSIRNKGPATVVLRVVGDPSFAPEIPPVTDEDAPFLFFGDEAYQYTLGLSDGRGAAKVQICN
jgi:hypothetical protein